MDASEGQGCSEFYSVCCVFLILLSVLGILNSTLCTVQVKVPEGKDDVKFYIKHLFNTLCCMGTMHYAADVVSTVYGV